MNTPYRIRAEATPEPVGHPLLDQTQGLIVDPGTKVTVYDKNYGGGWSGTQRIVIRSSRTHLEHECPILHTIKICEWSDEHRWLPS